MNLNLTLQVEVYSNTSELWSQVQPSLQQVCSSEPTLYTDITNSTVENTSKIGLQDIRNRENIDPHIQHTVDEAMGDARDMNAVQQVSLYELVDIDGKQLV